MIVGERLDGRIRGAIIVIVVIAGVNVDVSRVPRSIRQPPDPVMGVSNSSPALDAAIGGRPFVTSFRIGRRDRGRCVEGAGHDRGRDMAGVGASKGRLACGARGVIDPSVLDSEPVIPRVWSIGHGKLIEVAFD